MKQCTVAGCGEKYYTLLWTRHKGLWRIFPGDFVLYKDNKGEEHLLRDDPIMRALGVTEIVLCPNHRHAIFSEILADRKAESN